MCEKKLLTIVCNWMMWRRQSGWNRICGNDAKTLKIVNIWLLKPFCTGNIGKTNFTI